MEVVIGVDEAGRGPVLGSLFVGAVAVERRAILPYGVADSKTLDAPRREALADELDRRDGIQTTVIELTADEIDRHDGSLTEQVARCFAEAIDTLADADASASLDTGEADTERFIGRVSRYLSAPTDLEASIGADEHDPLVSAASIVAKEAREAHVADLAAEFGTVGSGYPSDPTTRTFLAEYLDAHGTLPACARTSWATSRDALAAAEQADLGAFVQTSRE